jgi:hypothetical protein
MTFRPATLADCPLLAQLNHQLIHDEGHRNQMTIPELEERMRGWLSGEYRATIFEHEGEVVAYTLFREQPEEIYFAATICCSGPSQWRLWNSCSGDSAFRSLAQGEKTYR